MKRSFACLVVLGSFATGCVLGHAEMVKRDKNGGVLALKGMRDKAMEDFERLKDKFADKDYFEKKETPKDESGEKEDGF